MFYLISVHTPTLRLHKLDLIYFVGYENNGYVNRGAYLDLENIISILLDFTLVFRIFYTCI